MTDDINIFYRGGPRPTSLTPRLWTLTFIIFVCLNFFIFMGFDLLLPTLSLYLEGKGRSQAEIGRIFGVFTISAVLVRMFASRLSRHFEAMGLARLGLLVCAAAGAGYFWAHTEGGGLAVRFLHGAGFGLAQTLLISLATQVIPPARMGEGMGYLGLGSTLALAVGPFFGIWLMEDFGYLTLFMGVASFYLGGIALLFFLPPIKLASARAGAPPPRVILIDSKVWRPSLMVFFLGVSLSSVSIFMALYCQESDLPYAGHFFVFSALGLLVARLFSGRVYDRMGPGYVILPSALMLVGCLLMLYLRSDAITLLTVAVLYGLSSGSLFSGLQTLTIEAVPISGRTEATASFFNAFDLGIGLGSLSLGWLAGQLSSYASVYLGASLMSAILTLFYLHYLWRSRSAA